MKEMQVNLGMASIMNDWILDLVDGAKRMGDLKELMQGDNLEQAAITRLNTTMYTGRCLNQSEIELAKTLCKTIVKTYKVIGG